MLNLSFNDYDFLENAYYGTGGFRDGSYLVSHPRETIDKFDRRREISYYLNYVAATVDSHVNPIFREEPQRDWNNNALFSDFVKDTDTAKTPLTQLMKSAALQSKLHGVAFIVVDNVSADDQPLTLAEVMAGRKFPYCYVIGADAVISWHTTQAGKLTDITYKVVNGSSDTDGLETDEWNWTTKSWKVKRASGEVFMGEHKLGRVPVVPLFSRATRPADLKPQSEFYSIARTNRRIYNLCSEIDELARNQAFSVLTYPVGEGQNQEQVKGIVVGTENVMAYDGTLSKSPDYITPDGSPLEQLRAERADLIQEIYRMASLSLVTGVQSQKSGVAKEWDYNSTNQTLADFANNIQNAESEIADIFGRWINQQIKYECKYSDDFGIIDIVAKLTEVSTALDLGVGGKFDIEAKKRAAAAMFKDLEEKRYDEVMTDIENAVIDESYSKLDKEPLNKDEE